MVVVFTHRTGLMKGASMLDRDDGRWVKDLETSKDRPSTGRNYPISIVHQVGG